MSQSSQSEKKSETNISELTEKVVFKGGKFNHNLLNMTNTIKATPPQEESEYQVKTQNNDNLSFRTNDEIVIKNKKNTIYTLLFVLRFCVLKLTLLKKIVSFIISIAFAHINLRLGIFLPPIFCTAVAVCDLSSSRPI